MAEFRVTPIEHDPFDPGPALQYATEAQAPAWQRKFREVVNRTGQNLASTLLSPLSALQTLGNELVGQSGNELSVGPGGAVAPISDEAIGNALSLSGNVMEGGLAMPRPAGSLGTFGGQMARTADLSALARAQKMVGQVAPEEIWKRTGWMQDPTDKQWKFEINDKDLKIDWDKVNAHSEEYDPQKYVMREANKKIEAAGQDPILPGDSAAEYAKKTWAAGIPVDELNILHSEGIKRAAANPLRLGDVVSHPTLFKAYPDMKGMRFDTHSLPPGTAGAYFDTAGGRAETVGVKKFHPDYLTSQGLDPQVFSSEVTLAHELQHAIQAREGFARGGSPRNPDVEGLGAQKAQELRQSVEEIKSIPKEFRSEEDWDKLLHLTATLPIEKNGVVSPSYGEFGYNALSGEAEANNVMKRYMWAASEHSNLEEAARESFPMETNNVPPYMRIPYRVGEKMK